MGLVMTRLRLMSVYCQHELLLDSCVVTGCLIGGLVSGVPWSGRLGGFAGGGGIVFMRAV